MQPRYLMGLDAGNGSGRCLLVQIDGSTLVTTRRLWTHHVAPGTGGWGFDLDVQRIWQLLAEAAREAMAKAGIRPDQVVAVAATGMRHSLVVLDHDGNTLLATPTGDARAAGEGSELAANYGPLLQQRSGHWPAPIFAAARLRWLANSWPDRFEQAATFLSLSDWIALRLSGQPATDPSQAGETLLLDLQSRAWAWDLVDELKMGRHLFPPVRDAGTVLGALLPEAAAGLGLAAGIPVAVGGADTQCALLAAGVTQPGRIGVIAGSTCPVQMALAQPIVDAEAQIWSGQHVVPGLWVMESNAGPTGDALQWIAGVLKPDSPQSVAHLAAEASKSIPGALGLTSTFGAGLMNASRMTLPLGSLTLTHMKTNEGADARAHVSRAILEGLAFAIKANVDHLCGVTHLAYPAQLSLAGGMSRSHIWSQMVCDVMNTPVAVPATPEASALGAAICAGAAAGIFSSLSAGATALAGSPRLHVPTAQTAGLYTGIYADWLHLYESRVISHEMAADVMLQTLSSLPEPVAPAHNTTPRPRILVTADMDDASLDRLRSVGQVEYASYREVARLLTGEDLISALQGYNVFVTEVDTVDLEALQRLPELKVIATCRGNAVNIDLSACTALGIPVLYAPGRNAGAVADLTVAFALMLLRQLPQASAFLRQPGSEAGDMGRMGQAHTEFLGRELWQKTIGLVGLGAVGRAVAQRLLPFGVRLLAYDPAIRPEDALLAGAEPVTLERLLDESDVVSLHAPVTPETQGMIGAPQLARMKQGACIINTARAALLDERALAQALASGHLAGAALDVFSVEPPGPDHPLLALPSVIATPHIAGNTIEVAAHQGQIVAEDLCRLLAGERPQHVANRQVLADFRWDAPHKDINGAALQALAGQPGPAVSDLQQAGSSPAVPVAEPAARPPQPMALAHSAVAEAVSLATTPQDSSSARGQMERILRAFIAHALVDNNLLAFAAKNNVIFHYTVTDLALDYYLGSRAGKVVGGMGALPQPAEVRMKMKAEILDGIMTGKVNGNKAAMSGKLSFSGDVRLAMSMQRIQADMIRLYTQACQEVGPLGPVNATQQPSVAPVAVVQAVAVPARSPAGVGDLRDELVEMVQELYSLQLITATGGNLSVRIPGSGRLWITPSQLYKRDLRPEMMVRIGLDGSPTDPDALSPSSERLMHCAIYQARPEVEAIIHAHAPKATALGLSGLPFLPISTEAAFLRELPRVPFIMPGTRELADAAARALGKNPALLLQNHGVLVAANSLRQAANVLEIVERTADLILSCYAVGKKPPVLPKQVIAQLQEVGAMMY